MELDDILKDKQSFPTNIANTSNDFMEERYKIAYGCEKGRQENAWMKHALEVSQQKWKNKGQYYSGYLFDFLNSI